MDGALRLRYPRRAFPRVPIGRLLFPRGLAVLDYTFFFIQKKKSGKRLFYGSDYKRLRPRGL